MSVVVAILMKVDFVNWTGAFDAIIGLSKQNPILFLKVLESLIDEVVEMREGRTRWVDWGGAGWGEFGLK